MTAPDVDAFLSAINTSLKKHFTGYKVESILKTPKSLKANIHLEENIFIAVRYNARNERTDFALIHNKERIFGYDNLKEWHCHPYESPLEHTPCNKPSIDKIITDIKKIYKAITR